MAHCDSCFVNSIEQVLQVDSPLGSLVPLSEDLGQVRATGILTTQGSADILNCGDVSRAKVEILSVFLHLLLRCLKTVFN